MSALIAELPADLKDRQMRLNRECKRVPICRHSSLVFWITLLMPSLGCSSEPVTQTLKYEVGATIAGPTTPDDRDSLLMVINGRLRDAGHARALNDHEIEIELYGEVNDAQLSLLKKRIESNGSIEFRLLAAPDDAKNSALIRAARELAAYEKQVQLDGTTVAEWVAYDNREFGPAEEVDERVEKRLAGNLPEALVLRREFDVTGEFLESVSSVTDEQGHPALRFTLNAAGGKRMRALTSSNLPDTETGRMQYLGIVFDGKLLMAPAIVSPIETQGQISGRGMSSDEIDVIIAVLEEGILPAEIREVSDRPVSP